MGAMSTPHMRTRMRALIGALAITLSIATVGLVAAPANAAQTPKGTVIKDSLFGMHVFDVQNGVWPTVPFGSLRLWDNQTAWDNIETSVNNFDWSKMDAAVANAQAHGMKDILMVMAGTPAWASADPNGPALPMAGAAGMPTNLSWWDDWVRQVVTRYKGKITAYQPWNEANLSTFSTATPAQMADLTKRAYDIIKSVDPNATVVAPSTGTRLTNAFAKFYPKYLAELGKRGWPVDVWSAHTYPASLGTPVDRAVLANMWIDALKAAGAPAKPMWDTENNFGLKGPGPANPDVNINGDKAGQWVARSYLDALRLGISRVYWYAWGPDIDLLGIQMNSAAPGAKAYATLQKWIVGATYNGCNAKGGTVVCNFAKAGKSFQIGWNERARAKSITFAKGATQVCDLNDTCKPLSGNKVTAAGPVYVG